MPNIGMAMVVERTISEIKVCFEKVEIMELKALNYIQEMHKDETGDNFNHKLEELTTQEEKVN